MADFFGIQELYIIIYPCYSGSSDWLSIIIFGFGIKKYAAWVRRLHTMQVLRTLFDGESSQFSWFKVENQLPFLAVKTIEHSANWNPA